jgi:hypothetical protein
VIIFDGGLVATPPSAAFPSLSLPFLSVPSPPLSLPFPFYPSPSRDDNPSCNSLFLKPHLSTRNHHRRRWQPLSCWEEDWGRLIWCCLRGYSLLFFPPPFRPPLRLCHSGVNLLTNQPIAIKFVSNPHLDCKPCLSSARRTGTSQVGRTSITR